MLPSLQKSKIKLAKELSDIVIYCKSVHFNGFEHSRENQACYEMASFKESKAFHLAETSGKPHVSGVFLSRLMEKSHEQNMKRC